VDILCDAESSELGVDPTVRAIRCPFAAHLEQEQLPVRLSTLRPGACGDERVTFEPVDGPVNDSIDDAYRAKYHRVSTGAHDQRPCPLGDYGSHAAQRNAALRIGVGVDAQSRSGVSADVCQNQ
jgi:hypothetical protein